MNNYKRIMTFVAGVGALLFTLTLGYVIGLPEFGLTLENPKSFVPLVTGLALGFCLGILYEIVTVFSPNKKKGKQDPDTEKPDQNSQV